MIFNQCKTSQLSMLLIVRGHREVLILLAHDISTPTVSVNKARLAHVLIYEILHQCLIKFYKMIFA